MTLAATQNLVLDVTFARRISETELDYFVIT